MQVPRWLWTVVGLTFVLSAGETGRQVAWAQKARNQQEHQHGSPHGGQMLDAGKYHLELVVTGHQTIRVYLYDDTMQPVALPTPEATLYLRLPGNKNHTLTLTAAGSGAEASWTTTTDVLQNVPTFEGALRVTLAGDTRNIRFTYKDGHGKAPHKH